MLRNCHTQGNIGIIKYINGVFLIKNLIERRLFLLLQQPPMSLHIPSLFFNYDVNGKSEKNSISILAVCNKLIGRQMYNEALSE